ncbi:ABC transporter permease [Aquamicrobium defluvii]|uniref:ABC transporter permease n=1 Tax=Aquamicrobium defluvii TaxID=69279 RepID=A0A011US06_9HYPH|nr:ABC transporter permease [Aquamicrobium defluvii]EXL09011.1 ABC transporter permease [Aquamicrobium defluvii]TDR33927.1 NitT/TauT family transport system permease protein [Aquamicrobium defluvii]
MSGAAQHHFSFYSRYRKAVSATLSMVALLLMWEAAVFVFAPPVWLLPAPSDIATELFAFPAFYAHHAVYTIRSALIGFAIALVVGMLAAIGIVYSRFLETTIYTLIVGINSIPKIALAPLFIIWLGTGVNSKLAIAALSALFPIAISSVLGLRSADPDALDLARSLRASGFQVLTTIRLPSAAASVFSGVKVGLSFALIGAIAGEFVASSQGLGYVIIISQGTLLTTRVFASLLVLLISGMVLFYVVSYVERLLIPWHVSQRGSSEHVMI